MALFLPQPFAALPLILLLCLATPAAAQELSPREKELMQRLEDIKCQELGVKITK